MDLKTYLSQKHGLMAQLCREIGAHAPDVSRWASGDRPIPIQYAASIEKATQGQVTRQEMFPDNWQTVWPELVEQPVRLFHGPTPVTAAEIEQLEAENLIPKGKFTVVEQQ